MTVFLTFHDFDSLVLFCFVFKYFCKYLSRCPIKMFSNLDLSGIFLMISQAMDFEKEYYKSEAPRRDYLKINSFGAPHAIITYQDVRDTCVTSLMK